MHHLVARHAPALIKEQHHADGRFVVTEMSDFLPHAIVEDVELGEAQVVDDALRGIPRRDAEVHEIDARSEGRGAAIER